MLPLFQQMKIDTKLRFLELSILIPYFLTVEDFIILFITITQKVLVTYLVVFTDFHLQIYSMMMMVVLQVLL
ncbi:MAG: hypothetical protein EBY80_13445 [Actinobacteria bacterium]|nr:hypothetical protein [Actinomycetota bacterium]